MSMIISACKAAGTPIPLFRHEPTGLWVEFPYRLEERSGGPREENRKETREETRVIAREETGEQIITLIKADSSITMKEMAKEVWNQSKKYRVADSAVEEGWKTTTHWTDQRRPLGDHRGGK